jgi:hypothetical protein
MIKITGCPLNLSEPKLIDAKFFELIHPVPDEASLGIFTSIYLT